MTNVIIVYSTVLFGHAKRPMYQGATLWVNKSKFARSFNLCWRWFAEIREFVVGMWRFLKSMVAIAIWNTEGWLLVVFHYWFINTSRWLILSFRNGRDCHISWQFILVLRPSAWMNDAAISFWQIIDRHLIWPECKILSYCLPQVHQYA